MVYLVVLAAVHRLADLQSRVGVVQAEGGLSLRGPAPGEGRTAQQGRQAHAQAGHVVRSRPRAHSQDSAFMPLPLQYLYTISMTYDF